MTWRTSHKVAHGSSAQDKNCHPDIAIAEAPTSVSPGASAMALPFPRRAVRLRKPVCCTGAALVRTREFLEAFRQCQRPSIDEFARRYPEHADEIREILAALALREHAKAADDTPGTDHQRHEQLRAPVRPHLRTNRTSANLLRTHCPTQRTAGEKGETLPTLRAAHFSPANPG
jgi:hypothetical protein